jgi:hypothetical protein
MEIKAGMPSSRGGNTSGRAKDYSIKALRDAERASVAQAEVAYSRFVSAWSERPKRKPTAPKRSGCAGATKEEPMPGIVTVAASPHHAPRLSSGVVVAVRGPRGYEAHPRKGHGTSRQKIERLNAPGPATRVEGR